MKVRSALCLAVFFSLAGPALARDGTRSVAPADEYFGRQKLSVLGIANTIRDAQARIDAGGDPRPMFDGPLRAAADAIEDWEAQYPGDPWIARDLLALEHAYLRVPTDDGFRLASETEAWLAADFPASEQAAEGRSALALNDIPYMPQEQPLVARRPAAAAPQPVVVQQPVFVQQPVVVRQTIPSYAIPWRQYVSRRGLPWWAR